LVMASNANFATNYVREQLAAQKIYFPPLEELTDEERQSECLVKYAGQQLTTGKQAERYANGFIGLRLSSMAGGKTYAVLGEPQSQLGERIAHAQRPGDPDVQQLRA